MGRKIFLANCVGTAPTASHGKTVSTACPAQRRRVVPASTNRRSRPEKGTGRKLDVGSSQDRKAAERVMAMPELTRRSFKPRKMLACLSGGVRVGTAALRADTPACEDHRWGNAFWLACHPQMRGTPKRRTTTGWQPFVPFPTVGTPPVERSGRNLSGLKCSTRTTGDYCRLLRAAAWFIVHAVEWPRNVRNGGFYSGRTSQVANG